MLFTCIDKRNVNGIFEYVLVDIFGVQRVLDADTLLCKLRNNDLQVTNVVVVKGKHLRYLANKKVPNLALLQHRYASYEADCKALDTYLARSKLLGVDLSLCYMKDSASRSVCLCKAIPDKNGVFVIPPFVSRVVKQCFDGYNGNYLKVINKSNRIADMSYLFADLQVEVLDLSEFDVAGCLSMRGLFQGCMNLKQLDLANFDTSNVINMSTMFRDCYALQNINLTNFNTAQVRYMAGMFMNCCTLQYIDLHSFNTSNVQDFSEMFMYCRDLLKLNIQHFDTSNATNLSFMFLGCEQLKCLNLGTWCTKNVSLMSGMFSRCTCLKYLNIASFDTTEVHDMSNMFAYCVNLIDLNLSHFNTNKVAFFEGMFYGCSGLKKLDLSSFYTSSKLQDVVRMFGWCTSLEILDIRHFDLTDTVKTLDLFLNCNKLNTIYLPKKEKDLQNSTYVMSTVVSSLMRDCRADTLKRLTMVRC